MVDLIVLGKMRVCIAQLVFPFLIQKFEGPSLQIFDSQII